MRRQRSVRLRALGRSILIGVGLTTATAGLGACGSASSTNSPAAAQTPVAVMTSATPRGWTPVSFGDAQFSIPHNWAVVQDDVPLCGEVDGGGTVFSVPEPFACRMVICA